MIRYGTLRNTMFLLSAVALTHAAWTGDVRAADYGAAVANGPWSNAATWTPAGGPPGATDDAYIGGSFPGGTLPTATVNLTADQSVADLNLGRDGAGIGTLDLNGFNLSVGNTITIGQFGGTGVITRTGGGTFSTANLAVQNSNSLILQSGDTISATAQVLSGAQLSTAATTNLSQGVNVFDAGSQLTLGANLSLSQDLDMRGTGASPATVDAGGHNISANNIFIGRFNTSGQILNRGTITAAGGVFVDRSNFTFNSGDSASTIGAADGAVVNLNAATAANNIQIASGGQVTTVATGNVSQGVTVFDAGSQLTLGANLSLSQDLDLRGTGASPATVDAAGHNISANNIFIGRFNTSGQILNRGTITAVGGVFVDRSNFTFNAGDSASTIGAADGAVVNLNAATAANNIQIASGGQVTTAAAGNVSQGVSVFDAGSQLTLGANMSLSQDLDLRGTGASPATVDAAGHNISANNIFIGRFNTSGQILNRGTITAASGLFVDRSNFTFNAGDSASTVGSADGAVVNLNAATAANNIQIASGGQVTTAAAGNVSQGVSVFDAGSQLTLGANMALSQDLDIRGTGATPATVDAAGHNISANNIFIGRFNTSGQILNRGTITAASGLFVDRSNFTFNASDSASTLGASDGAVVNLNAATALNNIQIQTGGQVTTVAASNVSQGILIQDAGSQLTLGANMSLSQDLDIRGTGASPATVDAAGHNILANNIFIGRFNTSGQILNRGTITAASGLFVDRSNFTFNASDSASTLGASDGAVVNLNAATALNNIQIQTGGQVTTVAAGNVSQGVLIQDAGSQLTLGANMSLSQDLDIRGTGASPATVDAGGHDIAANNMFIGRFGTAGQLLNDGAVTVNNDLSIDNSTVTLHGGNDQVQGNLQLDMASALTVQQAVGGLTGFTLGGSLLSILDTSVLHLDFDSSVVPGLDWVFRWANPVGGDRIATIDGLIGSGLITVSGNPVAYNVFNGGDGFTYVGYTAAPEPSTVVLCGMALGLSAICAWRRRNRRARGQ